MKQNIALDKRVRKNDFIISFIIIFIFFFFALFFYRERLYGDVSFYLLQLINEKRFVIEHGRFIEPVIEIIPYLLVRYAVDLRQVIIAASLNEWLYYFICFLVLAFVLKDHKSALAMLVTMVFAVRWNYFNPISELMLGCPLVFILWSLLRKDTESIAKYLLMIALSITIIYSHPLFLIFLPLIIVMHHLYDKTWPGKKQIAFYIIVLIIIAYRGFNLDPYEAASTHGGYGSLNKTLNHIIHFNYAYFLSYMIPVYLGSIFISVAILRHLIKNKNWLPLIFFTGIQLGYFLIVFYKRSEDFPDSFEPFERYLLPLTLFASLMFFTYCDLTEKPVFQLIILCFTVYHFCLLFDYGIFVSHRSKKMDDAIAYAQQFPEQKLAIRADNFYVKRYAQHWAISCESLLLSAQKGKYYTRQVSILDVLDSNLVKDLKNNQFFFNQRWLKDMNELNPDYFYMKASPLRYANTDSVQSNYPDSFFAKISVNLQGARTFSRNEDFLFPVTLVNQNGIPLTSGTKRESVQLSYQWWSGDSCIINEGLHSPIVGDVYTTLDQQLLLKTPKERGNYRLQIRLLFKDSVHKNIYTEYPDLYID